ncbi:dihydrofolate reductase family protein [Micromonospora cathayae]|uniref:Dihydrofolate reductase family protein n=1 Tax=Micromonospora cathayae TaxID=3028804 RepID=A0ABY8A0C9_9ACTN|nr:dihydrofolate reductase family protein [Micromonospora sp. HUAS 3]WDZ87777.1 dihydrofolate reductase family protein [Micromonospora sp. HUAS 3]
MRKLVVNAFLTLDGVMQSPGGPQEDPSGDFHQGGWIVNLFDDAVGETMGEIMGQPFDLLLGRRTYEIFASHWPNVRDDPGADALNAAHKYVASTTLRNPAWGPATVFGGDAPARIAELKRGDGPEIQVHGSSNLIQTLLRHDLVDEFRLMVFPVVVGAGKRLFGDGTLPRRFEVASTRISPSGTFIVTYQPTGEIEIGSFALAEPSEEEQQRRLATA